MSQKTAHVMSLLVAVLVLAGCMPKQARAHAQATMVEIDGQKTPWLIPDYVSWEWIFRLVSRRDELEGFEFSVGRWPGLTPEDRRRLYATAEAYIKHRTECDTRKEARYHELQDQHVSAEVSDRDLRGITLSCRYVTLEMGGQVDGGRLGPVASGAAESVHNRQNHRHRTTERKRVALLPASSLKLRSAL